MKECDILHIYALDKNKQANTSLWTTARTTVRTGFTLLNSFSFFSYFFILFLYFGLCGRL